MWHLAYLKDKHGLRTSSTEFSIRSTRAIAARSNERDDEENTDTAQGEKYLAAIAFDGDSIGKWVNGDDLTDVSDLRQHHENFSKALSTFALGSARETVEKHQGFLIYAGGDDVLALVPADAAIICAQELRTDFTDATSNIKDKNGNTPDASAGIAIAHFKAPLQDLIREAQKAEKRAKNDLGRSALAITLLKRSGEISLWGCQWKSGGLELYQKISTALADGSLSAKFPHRVSQLISPYLISCNAPR